MLIGNQPIIKSHKEATASTGETVHSFLEKLSFDSIKECKDIQLLAEALMHKLWQTVDTRTQRPRLDIHTAPERIDAITKAHAKFIAVIGALRNVSQNIPINSEQVEVLKIYKGEFTGPGGGPSRTSAMFDRVLALKPRMSETQVVGLSSQKTQTATSATQLLGGSLSSALGASASQLASTTTSASSAVADERSAQQTLVI